jgi:hypothetical protein
LGLVTSLHNKIELDVDGRLDGKVGLAASKDVDKVSPVTIVDDEMESPFEIMFEETHTELRIRQKKTCDS